MLIQPNGQKVELEKGPNVKPLPDFDALPETMSGPVILKTGDDVSTDEILPAGSRVLPFRSNIHEISKFTFYQVDENFYNRAIEHKESGFFIVGGKNYGQGSSREHAALAPRYLGLKAVIAVNFARIHFQNLANFGILPLEFADKSDLQKIDQGDILKIENVNSVLQNSGRIKINNTTKGFTFETKHRLSARQIEMILQGSLINVVKNENNNRNS
jgi:aconitate hydratase